METYGVERQPKMPPLLPPSLRGFLGRVLGDVPLLALTGGAGGGAVSLVSVRTSIHDTDMMVERGETWRIPVRLERLQDEDL